MTVYVPEPRRLECVAATIVGRRPSWRGPHGRGDLVVRTADGRRMIVDAAWASPQPFGPEGVGVSWLARPMEASA